MLQKISIETDLGTIHPAECQTSNGRITVFTEDQYYKLCGLAKAPNYPIVVEADPDNPFDPNTPSIRIRYQLERPALEEPVGGHIEYSPLMDFAISFQYPTDKEFRRAVELGRRLGIEFPAFESDDGGNDGPAWQFLYKINMDNWVETLERVTGLLKIWMEAVGSVES